MKKLPAKKGTRPRQSAAGWMIKMARSACDWRRAEAALGREHGRGAGSEAGDRLGQLVLADGQLIGVLGWRAAPGIGRTAIRRWAGMRCPAPSG